MNEYWERELHRLARRLRIWKVLSALDRDTFENNISKNMLLSAIVLRKVIEDEYQMNKEFPSNRQSSLQKPHFKYLFQTIPVVRYPFCGENVECIVELPFPADYGSPSGIIDIPLREICNSIVHSYVWALPRAKEKRCVQGILVSSDREKGEYLSYISLNDWIKILQGG